ncbi:MAG: 50S ribosomal protein L22 [Geminicoccaceae bacterium]|nr:50S ribosomal protein L22 [Geminicoccaceae bacterium]
MGKPKQERRLAENEASSTATLVRVSPQKLNVVAGMIRGMAAEKAVISLEFSQKRIAGTVKKALEAAIANAENNHGLDVDRLVVAEASVGKHMLMKRFRPRARGRASRVVKPFSKLRIVVREMNEEAA